MNIIKKSIGFILKKVHKLDRYFIDDKKIQEIDNKNIDHLKNEKLKKEYNKLIQPEENNNKINQNKDTINYQNSIDNFTNNYTKTQSNNFQNTNTNSNNQNSNNQNSNLENSSNKEIGDYSNKEINNYSNNQNNLINEKPLKNTYTKTELNKLENTKIYDVNKIDFNKINTIWDVIKIKENTQAEHIIKSLSADQWMDIEDIKRRIKLEFNIEYQNEKSLYPYIKTLTDINLIKVNNTGKKRTWKKNIILIENNK